MASAVKRFPLVGYDTLTNLQSGVIQGMAAEIDGIIHAYRGRYNELQVLPAEICSFSTHCCCIPCTAILTYCSAACRPSVKPICPVEGKSEKFTEF